MSKCTKVKNPCKICLGSVSHKNGLQCQGACQSWVHFSCLNYTPGKIKDIKAGIIKVTCPCPDCKTTMPKEYRTDTPYSCNNQACPANRPPKCDNNLCPINDPMKLGGLPQLPRPPPCPLSRCGNDCKQYSSPQLPGVAPQLAPPCAPPQMGRGGMHNGYPGMSPMSSSDACLSETNARCPSGCSSTNDIPGGDFRTYQNMGGSMPSFHVVEQMCNTVGQLTNQINDLMSKMKQVVKDKGGNPVTGYTSNEGGGGGGGGGGAGGPPTTCPPPAPPPAPCEYQGPKSMCPKPCFCPGNPATEKEEPPKKKEKASKKK